MEIKKYCIFIFDILIYNGEDVTNKNLYNRIKLMKNVKKLINLENIKYNKKNLEIKY